MSVIGGPNNPISNGLVYALDFKNNRCYVSGSNSAKSLTFTTATATVTGSSIYQIPNIINGLLQFNLGSSSTTGSWIQIPTTFDSINSLGQFTILVTAEGKGGINFLSDTRDTPETRFGASLGSEIGLGFGQGQNTQYGRGFPNPATTLSHVVYRYSSGSFTIFVNGLPISSSNTSFSQNRSQSGNSFFISGRHFQQDSLWSGSLGSLSIYNRALTGDEIRSNYAISAREYGLPTPPTFTIDENAYLFLQSAGITDPIITSSINTFVLGLKSASLWDKMIAIYPFVGTGSVGVNLTGSHRWNLKEPSLVTYPLSFTGSWNGSVSGSTPSGSGTNITAGGITPSTYYPNYSSSNAHISILSYDTPTSSSMLAGTGMTREVAVSTLAGDYGTPAAAYSVRKVRTAYSGALMDVRRSIDNVTSSIGYVSNGDLDTGSLLNFANAVGENSPGTYSGLAAAYSLRKVSASYSGNAIDVRRSSDNTTGSIGFDASGNLDTGSLTTFVLQQKNILLDSENFSTAAWQKASVLITTASITAPDSTLTGNKWEKTNVGGISELNSSAIGFSNTFGNTSISIYAKSGSISTFRSYGTSGAGGETIYDLSTGTIVSGTGSIESAGNGWYRCSAPANNRSIDLYFTGSVGDYIYIWGAQQTTGSTALLPYVKNTSTFNLTPFHGYVAQWYDQSGNNRHATQSVSTQQPVIISSGSLVTLKGKPSIYFDSVDDAMLTPTLLNKPYAVILVAQQEVVEYQQRIINSPTRNSLIAITRAQETVAAASDISSVPIGLVNTPYVVSLVNDTTSSQVYSNTVNKTTTFNNNDFGLMNFGASGVYNEPAQAFVSEVIAYTGSSQVASRPLIENNINNYYSIYTSSNAGYVARWYDQSGNNRHATQTTTGSQPIIVNSGSIYILSGKPAISSSQKQLNLASTATFTDFSFFTVTKKANPGIGSQGVLFSSNTYGDGGGDNVDSEGTPALVNLGSNLIAKSLGNSFNFDGTAHHLSYYQRVGSTAVGGYNGLVTGSASGIPTANVQVNSILAFPPSPGYSYVGLAQELIFYSNSLASSRQAIEYGINNYYNIYPQTSSFTTSSFAIYATSGSVSASLNNDLVSGISSTGPLGFITVSRTGSNSLTIARNGVTSSFAVPASGALSTGIYLGAINNNGLALANSPLGISFASVGTGLTGADLATLNRLTYNLQTNLGRIDPDAQAFYNRVTAASGSLTATEISAINTLVGDLKSYGVWSSMKAIYPMVGASSASCAQNLVNSRFTGTFTSGWTFASTGVTPNGTSAYMDTNFIPSSHLGDDSTHGSLYLNTNDTPISGDPVDFGSFIGGSQAFTLVQSSTSGTTLTSRNLGTIITTTQSTRAGFGITSKTSATVTTIYKNGVNLTSGNSGGTLPTISSYLGGLNLGSLYGPTNNRIAFHSLGDSLTSTQASNFYTAIQKFQTTLGRQV